MMLTDIKTDRIIFDLDYFTHIEIDGETVSIEVIKKILKKLIKEKIERGDGE